MKKLLSSVFMIFLVISLSMHVSPAAAAQASGQDTLTFSDLGFDSDMVLRGPYDSQSIRFDLPPTWSLQDGAELEMEVTTFSTLTNSQVKDNLTGAILEVSMNDQLQTSIPLISGEKIVYHVPIALESMAAAHEGGQQKLSFFLNAAIDCNFDFYNTTVIISASSKAIIPHYQAPLPLDLRRLPWPLYVDNSNIAEPVTFVFPSAPTPDELQAGFIVMGAFGRMTGGKIPLKNITTDQLSEEVLSQSHLIFVGKPASFPMLSSLTFPVPLVNSAFSSPELSPDDGIIQVIASPWNNNRSILFVSGNTDQAVVKGAQALSTTNIQTDEDPTYSIVTKVNPFPSSNPEGSFSGSPDITFSDLGYSFEGVTGIGSHWVSYEFFIPAGKIPSEDVYLDLNISSSRLVDPARSEGVVFVNDVQVGSVTLSSDTSNIINSKVQIPSSTLKTGRNQLDLVWNLLPRDACSLFTFTGLWITIYPDSVLHLPLTMVSADSSPIALRDLKAYPSPFSNDPSLSTTTFIVSRQDPNSWLAAGKVAFDLGTRVTNSILGFRVAFDGQIPEELKSSNLILVGLPKYLTIVSELRDGMPAYYENGSNLAVLETQQVVYRASEGKSLGYLQLFSSPWNLQAAILGIFGTTSDGLGYAVNSITTGSNIADLSGNFVTLDGSHAWVVDTRTGLGIGRVSPELVSAVVAEENTAFLAKSTMDESAAKASAAYQESKQLVFFAILVVLSLIAVSLILMMILGLVKRKSRARRL